MTDADLKRFWSSVDKDGPGGCWLWMGRRQKGYGYFSAESKQHRVSRLSWVLHHGPIPDGMQVLHACDNPPCCNANPGHLFLGTIQDNMTDRDKKGRLHVKRGTECHTAILDDDKVRQIRILIEHGLSTSEIGLLFGVRPKVIRYIKTGRTWRHVMPLKEAA